MAVVTGSWAGTAATVGGYRRCGELRTTRLGTWCLGESPEHRAAGLLVVDPRIDVQQLVPLTRRLAQLRLPGVAPIHDLLAEADQNWLIVSLAPGPTIADLTGSGTGDADSVVTLARDTASALLSMHRRGLAHGNVGPEAVVLDGRGAARLLDWSGGGVVHTAADDVREWAQLIWGMASSWCTEDFTLGVGLAKVAGTAVGRGGLPAALSELAGLVAEPPRTWLAETSAFWLAAHGLPAGKGEAGNGVAGNGAVGNGTAGNGTAGNGTAGNGAAGDGAAGDGAGPGGGARSLLAQPAPVAVLVGVRTAVRSHPVPEPRAAEPEAEPEAEAEAVPDGAVPDGPVAASVEAGGPSTEPPSEVELRRRDDIDLARLTARAGRSERRKRTILWSLVSAAALTAGALLALLPGRSTALQVQFMSVQLERSGPVCTVVGTIITNGRAGSVTYRWTGDTPPVPPQTATLVEGQSTVRISQNWAGVRPAGDPSTMIAALELMAPAPRRAFIELGPDCR